VRGDFFIKITKNYINFGPKSSDEILIKFCTKNSENITYMYKI